MLKILKKTNGLAITSFFLIVVYYAFLIFCVLNNTPAHIVPRETNLLYYLITVGHLLPIFSVIFGILAFITISFECIKTKKFDKYMKLGIVLLVLGIIIGFSSSFALVSWFNF